MEVLPARSCVLETLPVPTTRLALSRLAAPLMPLMTVPASVMPMVLSEEPERPPSEMEVTPEAALTVTFLVPLWLFPPVRVPPVMLSAPL